jgi:hypothetical protein
VLRLAQNSLTGFGIIPKTASDTLQSNTAMELGVVGVINFAHPARPELASNKEPSHPAPGQILREWAMRRRVVGNAHAS